MEFGKFPKPETNVQPGNCSLHFEIDLNETPLSSHPETLAAEAVPGAAKDGVFSGEVRRALCGCCGKAVEMERDVLVCCDCGRGFHMRCLGTKEDQKSREWECLKCLLRNGIERLPGGLGLFDINASPPREVDGEGFLGELQGSGQRVPARDAEQNGDKELNYKIFV